MAIKSRSILRRVLLRRQPQAKCQALDVSVHDNPRGDAKGGAQNDVGRFAADARQGGQGFHVPRNLAGMVRGQTLGHGLEIPRLGPKEPSRADQLFNFFLRGHRHA